MDVSHEAERAGRRADNSDWMDHAVRVGLVSYGVVHLLLAWLALRLALGDGGGSASSQGALHQLAKTPVGLVSLYVVAAGFVALVVWQALEAVWGHRDQDGGKRVRKRADLRRQGGALRQPRRLRVQDRDRLVVRRRRHRRDHREGDERCRPGRCWSARSGVASSRRRLARLPGLAGEVPRQAGAPTGRPARTAAPTCCSARSATSPRASPSRSSARCSSTPRSPTTRRSPAASTRRCTSCSHQPFGAPLLVVIALGFACYGLFCFAWARHLDR